MPRTDSSRFKVSSYYTEIYLTPEINHVAGLIVQHLASSHVLDSYVPLGTQTLIQHTTGPKSLWACRPQFRLVWNVLTVIVGGSGRIQV